jgi:hypothetical protein
MNIHTYAIYLNPPSHPNKWVVTRTRVGQGAFSPNNGLINFAKPWIVTDTYLEAVSRIPLGLTRIGPPEDDNSHLYETWR